LVHDGKIIEQGDPSEIIVSYSKVNAESLDKELDKKSKGKVLTQIGSGEAVIQKIWTERDNRPRNSFAPHDTVKICVEVVVKRAVEAPVFGINILDSQNRVVFATNTNVMGITNKDLKAGHTVTAEFTLDNIYTNGSYTISGAVANKDRTAVYARVENAHTFAVTGWQLAYPLAHPDHTFMLK
jgi:ABC-2 type transport system ATP-binding protein